MSAYYNEIEPYAAQWLRNLIAAGQIAPGEVDERDIRDVQPDDLRGFAQCHFFAGIGGWSYALRLANWSDETPVWTGSCPCQPFSVAGKSQGVLDERHLWPAFRRLIAECKPSVCFGEQVASKDGKAWLAGVRIDLEALGYAVGAADLCAAGIGANHIRQRLYFTAHASRLDGKAHDCVVQGREGGTSEPIGRFPRIMVVETRWYKDSRTSARPILVPNDDGIPGILAGCGNAIVPQVAQAFIEAAREVMP